MRLYLLPIIAVVSMSAATATPDQSAPLPADLALSPPHDSLFRIERVREELGQPKLDRSPATPGRGYLIAAVDKRVDGCPVMQMLHDADDLRPLPPPTLGPARLMPAR